MAPQTDRDCLNADMLHHRAEMPFVSAIIHGTAGRFQNNLQSNCDRRSVQILFVTAAHRCEPDGHAEADASGEMRKDAKQPSKSCNAGRYPRAAERKSD